VAVVNASITNRKILISAGILTGAVLAALTDSDLL
jgi:Trk K+ transport system NAD-binding subunit